MLLYNTHSPLSFGLGVAIDPVIDLLFFIPIGNFVDQHRHKPILIIRHRFMN
ncbi:MAG: MFS transporter [Acetilactobacillus jinshanensis]